MTGPGQPQTCSHLINNKWINPLTVGELKCSMIILLVNQNPQSVVVCICI